MPRSRFQFGSAAIMQIAALVVVGILLMSLPDLAQAQIAAPWEDGMCKFTKAVTGKWIGWIAIIAIVFAAVMYGVGESNQNFQTSLRIVAGFSIALSAAATAGFFFPGLIASLAC